MSTVLIIAPHADDEVLGVGGTIARLSAEGNQIVVAILTGRGPTPHPLWPKEIWDTVRSEAVEAHEILGVERTVYHEIPAAMVADQPTYTINKIVVETIRDIKPQILFVPFIFDLHKDHREFVYAATVAWRPTDEIGRSIKEIYMYETLSETHWNIQQQEGGFLPNAYVDISGDYLKKKIDALREYRSQIADFPSARSVEGVEALAKFRGCTIGVEAAEAFVLVRKIY